MPPPGDRLPTGLPGLDTCLRGGLAPGRVYTVIGPPHRGKTALISQLGLYTARHSGATVVGLYYDEGSWQAGLMMAEGIGHDRIQLEDAYSSVQAEVEASFQGIAILMPNPSSAESNLENVETGLVARGLADSNVVIVVDSIQRARCRSADEAPNAKDRADSVMQLLRGIVRRHPRWLVITAAKANRGSWANKNPALNFDPLAAGLDSSSIEFDSDFIAFLDGKSKDLGKGIRFMVLKNRPGTGELPVLKLRFDRARATFSEVDDLIAEQEENDARDVKSALKAEEHVKTVLKLADRAERLLRKSAPKRLSLGFLRKAVGGNVNNLREALEGLENQGAADWVEGPRESILWGMKGPIS